MGYELLNPKWLIYLFAFVSVASNCSKYTVDDVHVKSSNNSHLEFLFHMHSILYHGPFSIADSNLQIHLTGVNLSSQFIHHKKMKVFNLT